MTILTLTKLHIASVADLSDQVIIQAQGFSTQVTDSTTIRRYSQGRDRAISTPGRTLAFPVTCVHVSRADYLELEERSGTAQLLRDTRGRRVFGLISALTGTEARAYDRMSGVSFTFTSLTVSEAV